MSINRINSLSDKQKGNLKLSFVEYRDDRALILCDDVTFSVPKKLWRKYNRRLNQSCILLVLGLLTIALGFGLVLIAFAMAAGSAANRLKLGILSYINE